MPDPRRKPDPNDPRRPVEGTVPPAKYASTPGPDETSDHPPGPARGPAPTVLGPGSVLGLYRLVRVLGAGGMGEVYLATDTSLDREVAVKTMLPQFAADPDAKKRFLREARTQGKVRHENVVGVYAVGEEGGIPYLVMPLLHGESLEARLKRAPRLGPADACRIGREVADGLAAAHALGLVHRDIKPSNVWLEGPRAKAMVLDFGLARATESGDGLTRVGAVVGTPSYMAPEQAGGGKVDHRCDVFSLGVVLYELCTGRRPFAGESTLAILTAIALHQPQPPHEADPAVPVELSRLILRMLSKQVAARPQTMAEVADVLSMAMTAAHRPLAVPVPPPPPQMAVPLVPLVSAPVAPPVPVADPVPVARRSAVAPRPRRTPAGTFALALVSFALGLGALGGSAYAGAEVFGMRQDPYLLPDRNQDDILTYLLAAGIAGLAAIFCGLIGDTKGNASCAGRGMVITGLCLGMVGLLAVPVVYFWYSGLYGSKTTQDVANLKQVHGGMIGYEAANLWLPASNAVPSWRVELLPYVNEPQLYGRFDKKEAWNGTKNKAVSDTPVRAYTATDAAGTTQTRYRVFTGPNTPFPGGGAKPGLREFPDGAANTILVAESADPGPWAEPKDIAVSPSAVPQLGKPGADRFAVVMADGSVRLIKKTIDPKVLRQLIDPKDGGVVRFDGDR